MKSGPQPQDTPSTLYKYRHFADENHLKTIEEGSFWFAHADSFNDPFDVNWGFDYSGSEEKKWEWALDFLGRERPELDYDERVNLARQRLDEIAREDGYIERISEEHIRQNKEKFGICSLSAVENDILMWSHYSGNHTGFCVGIDTDRLEEIQRRRAKWKDVVLDLHKVDYAEEIPQINFFDSMLGGGASNILLQFITTKSTHWEYEDEYRLLLYDGPNTAYQLGIEVVSEVIFGCRSSEEDQTRILSTIDGQGRKDVSVYKAEKHPSRYELVFNRVR